MNNPDNSVKHILIKKTIKAFTYADNYIY